MSNTFPTEGMALTHILVVSDLDRARIFYRDVLGATIYGEYGGTSIVTLMASFGILMSIHTHRKLVST